MTTQPSQPAQPARSSLTFELPDGSLHHVDVVQVLNAGYAGRSQDDVAAHVAELAELGVPAPSVTPALYPVSPTSPSRPAGSASSTATPRARPSGRWSWPRTGNCC